MKTDDYDFELPEALIAQHPAKHRDASRLLVVNRSNRSITHHRFADLPEILCGMQLSIFRNNASVMRARIYGQRPTGGKVECVLLTPTDADAMVWECLVKPGRKLPAGATFAKTGFFTAEILSKTTEGTAMVRFAVASGQDVVHMADACGELPLPPYIERNEEEAIDAERYQTVYADPNQKVAAAAPTAGLHFTEAIEKALSADGHHFYDLTLRVGLGTFRTVKTENIADHPIHTERYWIAAELIEALRNPQCRRLAVGTTSVRTIEDALRHAPGTVEHSWSRDADLFIIPPCPFLGVDHLITNFHLPRSTLFGLVAAFLAPNSVDGVSWLKEIYREAITRQYRFFSYGDAMLIL